MRALHQAGAVGALPAALLATVLLGGCSGGSDDASRTPAPSSPASPRALSSQVPATPVAPSPGTPPATPSAGATPTGQPPTTAAAGARACASPSLQVSLPPGGSALDLFNAGPVPCTLTGAPTVVYVAGGSPVGAPAAQAGPEAMITLLAGGTARVALHVLDYRTVDRESCQASPVDGLRVVLPGQAVGTVVAAPGMTCADPSVPILTVGPVQAG